MQKYILQHDGVNDALFSFCEVAEHGIMWNL